jgi:hypothetical protein
MSSKPLFSMWVLARAGFWQLACGWGTRIFPARIPKMFRILLGLHYIQPCFESALANYLERKFGKGRDWMAGGLTRLLKRWRDNYYVSQLLAYSAKPLRFISAQASLNLEQKVRKNSVTIRLPNGKNMSIGRNSGIGIASLLFWHGLDGYEPETSGTLRFFFERAATFIDVGANCGLYSVLGALWNSSLQVIAFEPVVPIFDSLRKNVLVNRLEDRIRCENMALSCESGRATLFLPAGEGLDVESTGTLVSDSWQCRKGSPRLEG